MMVDTFSLQKQIERLKETREDYIKKNVIPRKRKDIYFNNAVIAGIDEKIKHAEFTLASIESSKE
jgi:hypothetical protein